MNANDLLFAFGGGIFGAAIGALPAFEFVGFLVMIGVAVQIAIAPASTTFWAIPFGAFGPHVGGFASGVAAAAYAASRGKLNSGRNILPALMGLRRPDVLLVGGAFGIFGCGVQWALAKVPGFGPGLAWTDTVALTVTISGIVTRFAFGKSGLFGKAEEGRSFYSPSDSIRWIAFASEPAELITLGLGVGLFAGGLALALGVAGVFLAFGIAAAALIFLQFGVAVPVTHHMALPAAIAAAASGSILVGGVVGVICALLAELIARTFLCHGDTHIDPPAATIAIMTTIINALTAFKVFALLKLPV